MLNHLRQLAFGFLDLLNGWMKQTKIVSRFVLFLRTNLTELDYDFETSLSTAFFSSSLAVLNSWLWLVKTHSRCWILIAKVTRKTTWLHFISNQSTGGSIWKGKSFIRLQVNYSLTQWCESFGLCVNASCVWVLTQWMSLKEHGGVLERVWGSSNLAQLLTPLTHPFTR